MNIAFKNVRVKTFLFYFLSHHLNDFVLNQELP